MQKEKKSLVYYMNALRRQQGISLGQLCEGLCNERVLSYLEKGERRIGYFLQRRILERLGIDTWDYEVFVGKGEYECVCMESRILYMISERQYAKALLELEEYKSKFEVENPLWEQFYWSMKAQIAIYEDEADNDVYDLLKRALFVTVPAWNEDNFDRKILSMTEMNLILELARFSPKKKRQDIYKRVCDYVYNRNWDRSCLAKIYPKAVYLLCATDNKEGKIPFNDKMDMCGKALDLLRDSNRTYYLFEILSLRRNLLKEEEKENAASTVVKKKIEQNRKWLSAVNQVCRDSGQSPQTDHFMYFYVTHGVYAIHDVIRKRRKMLGISREKLGEHLCDVKTIGRMERGDNFSQEYILQNIAERLSLPEELMHLEVIFENPKLRNAVAQLRTAENKRNSFLENKVIEEIETALKDENKGEQQFLEMKQAFLLFREGRVDKEEYGEWLIRILEKTVGVDQCLHAKEKYLTETEIQCIHHLMNEIGECDNRYKQYVELLHGYFEPFQHNALYYMVAPMFDLVMFNVARHLAGGGELDTANEILDFIFTKELSIGRAFVLSNILYEKWRNDKSTGTNNQRLLKLAIDIAELYRKEFDVQYYTRKLKEN